MEYFISDKSDDIDVFANTESEGEENNKELKIKKEKKEIITDFQSEKNNSENEKEKMLCLKSEKILRDQETERYKMIIDNSDMNKKLKKLLNGTIIEDKGKFISNQDYFIIL